MPIQYKSKGFPDTITCQCGVEQELRKFILEADQRKQHIDEDELPHEYFAGVICQSCDEYIWYVVLDYRSDIREIGLLTPQPMSLTLELDEPEQTYNETKQVYEKLAEKYLVDLEFPATTFVMDYIRHHEISHIKDDIFAILPLVIVRPQLAIKQSENADIVLVIPYNHNDSIYGEIKVNYNLSQEDREDIKELCFGIWDLLSDHYFGPLDELNWEIEELLE